MDLKNACDEYERFCLFEDAYRTLTERAATEFAEKFSLWERKLGENSRKAGIKLQEDIERVFCRQKQIDIQKYDAFLSGDIFAYTELRPVFLEYLSYSGKELHPLLRCECVEKNNHSIAATWLTMEMSERMCETSGISKATWQRIKAGTHAPSQETLERFRDLLSLEEVDLLTLKRMLPRNVIYDTGDIIPMVQNCWNK